jgi:uncharacterized membrane protein
MERFTQYYGRFQGVRGNLTTLSPLGRLLIGIAAVPGVIILALSIVLFIVSLFALLLLTVPVYRIVRGVQGVFRRPVEAEIVEDVYESPGRKAIESTVE